MSNSTIADNSASTNMGVISISQDIALTATTVPLANQTREVTEAMIH